MEADIIVEGFLNANKHGVRYMTIIADGDSSVFARIKEEVPIWGQSVQKAECANHVCKCLRSNLEKLVDENPSYKGKGNLPKSTRIRIVSSVRCAIRMRSAPNVKNAARLLEKDIKNSVHHVYGNHMNCSSDFCKGKQVLQNNGSQCGIQNETNCDKDIDETSTAENNDYDVISDQIDFWTEGSSIQDQEEARFDSQISCSNSKLLNDIAVILNRVAAKSDRLIGNYTTNLAECWMNIRTKFDGGKMYNHCQRGSWHTRCFAGALRFNEGANWSPQVWEKSTNTVAGEQFQKLYKQRETCLNQNNIYKNCLINKQKRWKRKYKVGRESNTKKARMEYGKEAVDYEPDVTSEELDRKVKEFMDKQINITNAEIEKTEENTKDQSQSEIWKVERKKRLTASNFGSVFKRNPKIKVSPLVKSILYSSFKGTKLTQNGLNKENVTVTEYIEQKKLKNENVKFEKMGLVISKEQPLLAASPDGRITDGKGNSGLIEIKNILYNKPLSLTQAAKMKSVKNFCLEINSNSELLSLKKNHNYYYQCQGLLYVTKCEWIDFVVRTEHPYELHIERIFFNQPLWENHIFPKLKAFYHKALVPEIVVPRYGKIPGIREPGQWVRYIQFKTCYAVFDYRTKMVA